MKFILNEHKKFILEEKFILKEAEQLTEASAAEVALKWTNNFKSTLENTKNVLNKYISFAGISKNSANTKDVFTKTKDNINKTWAELEISLSMPEKDRAAELVALKAELKQYIDALNVVNKEIKDKKSKYILTILNTRIAELAALDTKTEWTRSDFDDLVETHEWVEDTLLPLFDTTDIDNTSNNVEIFKQTCNDCLTLINIITNSLPNNFADFDDTSLRNYIEIMKTSAENTTIHNADSINKGLVIANIETFLKQVTKLKQNYEKISNTTVLSATRAKADQEKKDAEILSTKRQGREWESIYNKCLKSKDGAVATEKFWNGGLPTDSTTPNPNNLPIVSEEVSAGYYKAAWGEHAELIKSFTPFVQQVLELGWTERDNAFISYLHKCDKDLLSKEAYSYIHNAFIKSYISENDLRAEGPLEKYNLIFQPGFLVLKIDGTDYLEKQKWVVANINKIIVAAGNNNETALGKEEQKNIIFNIFSASGNDENISALPEGISKAQAIQELRSINELDRLLRRLGKSEVKKVAVATDKDVQIVLDRYTSAKDASKVLSYLTTTFYNSEAFKALDNKLIVALKLNKGKVNTTFEEFESFDKFFKITKAFTTEQLEKLFTELSKKAGFVE